ncbi:NAD(P)-dependent dehydrogenase (short-subunit alcohol dehydrogenase family) [Sphingobium wenxiniae]|uniref:Short-chain dehydrogenase n=2 Tax=Sphingobium TaxID=165695 RepID=T0HR26_9SPHN|nr:MULTISPECIES: SDR family NAD(P)-dependent oxidoreductase [Sphingobium]EQA99993.1 hypothetical protein L485_13850 [Sphingobium baderi LL03]KMS61803.1 oxidoreductase [Sphingobium baderi LL03]MBB6190933.1 NAD(P)-dependent dehydrogenase (short-subunit alcohol dehydrogenase family) [Sphingobium wenxiniae]TWH93761.1 short subunit dehydrogenase [Sphingobium wenxiniae]
MSDRIAIVTGGSLGLGREVARGLLAQGYRVAIFGRSQASLDEAVADLGGDVLGVSVDVGNEASVAAGFAKVDEAMGPVTTLVNVAAIFEPFAIEEATAERILPLVHINFCGAVYCMREAVTRMRRAGHGDIVNVSSESVRQSTPFFSIYTSTKAALETMTTLMGEELREDGIRCTIFRVGRMHSHGAANTSCSPDLLPRFIDRCEVTGASYWTGAGMQPASAALALVNLLLTPRDARVELIEVRSY